MPPPRGLIHSFESVNVCLLFGHVSRHGLRTGYPASSHCSCRSPFICLPTTASYQSRSGRRIRTRHIAVFTEDSSSATMLTGLLLLLFTAVIPFLCVSSYLYLAWTNPRSLFASAKRKTAVVLVLGDVGRSPRMMYHTESLAKLGWETSLIGSRGELCSGWPISQLFRNLC